MAKQLLTVAVFGGEDLNNGDDLFSVEVETHLVDLLVWWIKTAASDFDLTTGKIQEYGTGEGVVKEGSADMRAIGEIYAELLGWPEDTPSETKQQLAAWTYLVGKLGRCIANFQQAQPVKPDTAFDATIYTLMMRRIAETGNWP